MEIGDRKSVEIPSERAYGELNPNARQNFPRDKFPDDLSLDIGTRLQLQSADGRPVMVTIAEVNEDHVVLDGNHPLAGKDLTFDIELVEIVGD